MTKRDCLIESSCGKRQRRSSSPMAKDKEKVKLPEGVITSSEYKGKIIFNAVRIGELSFNDFSQSTYAFKTKEGVKLSKAEKIIIDNLWVSNNKNDKNHLIAGLNALSIYLTQKGEKSPCYVVFVGKKTGIYKSWVATSAVVKGIESAYKKYNTFVEAKADADKYLVAPYWIDPELLEQKNAIEKSVITTKKQEDFSKERLQLCTTITKLEEEKLLLQQKIKNLEDSLQEEKTKVQHLHEGTSYAGDIAPEGMTKEDQMMMIPQHIQQNVVTVLDNQNIMLK